VITRLLGSRSLVFGAAALSAVALAGCGGSGGSQYQAAAVQGNSAARVEIPAADRFSPFALIVKSGTTVTVHNADSDAHSVVSVPGDPSSFNRKVAAGGSWSVTLTSSGLYRYYCSIHARYDPATQQVEGLSNADKPSQPMEGVIEVQ
jgi:plastocyanin